MPGSWGSGLRMTQSHLHLKNHSECESDRNGISRGWDRRQPVLRTPPWPDQEAPTPIPLLSRGTIRMQRKEKVDQGSPDSGGKLTANLLCDLQEVTRPL